MPRPCRAEPAPGFAWENSINHSLSSSTTYSTRSMLLDLTTHYFCCYFWNWLILIPDTLLFCPARGSDGSSLPVDRSSPSWACLVCPAHCPLQLTFSSLLQSWKATDATQLSHAGLAVPIGLAIYDLCSKCNLRPQFWPQNGLVMQLCIVYVFLVDPKVSHAKNEPDP